MRAICVIVPALLVAIATAAVAAGAPPQAPTARGAKVTFERVLPPGSPPQRISQRARLLSLAVERGETPSPFLEPGLFRATFVATVTLPARDRVRFRIEGRGSVRLEANGEQVLGGALRGTARLESKEPARLKKGENQLVLHFESQANGEGQLRLYWAGTGFGFEPIAPESLQHRADDEEVLAGQQRRLGLQLFAERRCARCHEYETRRIGESAFAELDHAAPDLRTIGSRTHQDWLAAWLQDPRRFRHEATMPRLPLSATECGDLAAWLAGLGGAPAPVTFAADAAAKGGERFRQLGCVGCHAAPGASAADAALGDRLPLTFVAQKWHPAALVEYLVEPARFHPDVRMPDLRLAPEAAQQIAAFLLAAAPAPLPVSHGDAARGKRLAQKQACGLCHALDLPLDDRPFPRLPTLQPERGCLGTGAAAKAAPDHGLTAEQRQALQAFLADADTAPFRRAPMDFFSRHVVADRCVACHGFDGEASVWARVSTLAATAASSPLPKDQDPVAQGVPALTWTGSKLQPSWIERFVTGKEPSPRPWLTARMPVYQGHGAAMAKGLVREHGYGSQDEAPTPVDAQSAIFGERLVNQGTGFDCVLCHALGDRPARQVPEREGIELLTARGRLRHEYYTRWLADPPRLDADARMPRFADDKGRTNLLDVLGGDAAQQFEAIWQFLGSRRGGR
ncbi:MAG: c-type cytochrome [Planctomycetes bacterium]|nr:c-type cytochrome [Planctomycetota bacterium]